MAETMSCTPSFSGCLPCSFPYVCLGSYQESQTLSATTLEDALVFYLTNHPVVGCLVGSRIYANAVQRKNTSWPVITYTRGSTDHAQGISGSLGYAFAHLELDVWSTSYSDCPQVAAALRQALQSFHGWWGCVGIHGVTLDGEDDAIERAADGSAVWFYSRSLDVNVCFSEPVYKF